MEPKAEAKSVQNQSLRSKTGSRLIQNYGVSFHYDSMALYYWYFLGASVVTASVTARTEVSYPLSFLGSFQVFLVSWILWSSLAGNTIA